MCVFVVVCTRVYVYVFMYVCALDKTASGAANCLWPNAMIRLAPHWHAVKRAGIIGFAICTIGYLYLRTKNTTADVCCRAHLNKL